MMDFLEDSRFAAVAKDPRFRQVPKQERKVEIDSRFQGMFTDKRFKLKYSVDKRGRPENRTSGENLKKFYELEDSDESCKDENDAFNGRLRNPDSQEDEVRNSLLQGKRKKQRQRSGRELLIELKRRKSLASSDFSRKLSSGKQNVSVGKAWTEKKHFLKSERGQIPPQDFHAFSSGCEEMKGSDEVNDDYSSSEEEEEEEGGLCSDDKTLRLKGVHVGPDSAPEPSWQKQIGIDLARGEGNVETSSSDSDSDDDNETSTDVTDASIGLTTTPLVDGELCHNWGELDVDAPREEATSRRLAVCNIDWDCVSASDLFVLLNSFKPTGGILHSVKIYPSDFGVERMREEDAKGPQELVEKDEKKEKLEGRSQERYQREKLRKYQLQRLKYFYAVVECDSALTANAIYEECDGMEYETSASKLDLRFIPDDTTFDLEARDEAHEAPDAVNFKPMEFQTTALTSSSVQLTWDGDDMRRVRETEEAFRSKGKNVEQMMESHIKTYLASSSSDEEEEDEEEAMEENSSENEDNDCDKPQSEKERINKYRNLLKGIENKEKQDAEDRDMQMEISWEPGLKESTQEMVKKKSEVIGATPWEKYLEKKKDKKKERKEQRKKKSEKSLEDENDEGQAFSDDEVPEDVDLSDSFFKDSLKTSGKTGATGKRPKKKEDLKTEEEIEDEKQRKAALELLMLDEEEEGGRQHFNLKNIIENENMTKSKRKRKLKQERKLGQSEGDTTPAPSVTTKDDFKIDTKDPRFEALFTSHEYAIDPSDPHYKKTKAMSTLITEKQKRGQRREEGMDDEGAGGGKSVVKKRDNKKDMELSQLVKSIKCKTEQFHSRKKLKVDF